MSAADRDAVDRATARAALAAMPRPLPGPIEYQPGWRLRHWTWTVIDRRGGHDLAEGRTVTNWGARRRRHRAYDRLLNADVRKRRIETSALLNRFRSWVN